MPRVIHYLYLFYYEIISQISVWQPEASRTYVFLLLLTVYTNLWLHQRIFVALIGILLVMIFCRSIISLRQLKWFPAVFIIGITIILVSFELDARTALWRESIQAVNFEYFSIGGYMSIVIWGLVISIH